MATDPVLNVNAFKHVCRTCMHTKDLFFIDEVQWDNLSLKKVLGNWISFETNYELKLPQQICKPCLKLVVDIQSFIDKIQRTDNIFKNALLHEGVDEIQLPKTEPNGVLQVKNEELEDIKVPKDDSDIDDIDRTSDISFTNDAPIEPVPNRSNKPKRKTRKKRTTKKTTEESHQEKIENEIEQVMGESFKLQNGEPPTHDEQGRDLIHFCGVCHMGYHIHKDLKVHKRKLNHYKDGASYHICPYCKKKINLHGKLKDHMVIHKNEKPNLCSHCGKGFTAKSDLSRHVRNVHLKMRSLKCKFCYKLFSQTEKLKEHEATHENINYVCSFCGKDFKVYQYWAAHERAHKRDGTKKKYENKAPKREYQCSDCGKIYYTKQGFEEHVREHTGTKWPCDLCKKEFPTELKMKKHKDFVHNEGKYTCDICGHTVKQKPILENHIKTVHQGEKTAYKCEHCEKVFYNKNSYKLHARIHTNDTKYQCQICFRIHTTKRNLDRHMRVHTGERPHECSHCGKRFAAKENMTVHMKTHTGPPTCQCPLCPRVFYTNGILQKHIRNVHDRNNDDKNPPRPPRPPKTVQVPVQVPVQSTGYESDESENDEMKRFTANPRKGGKFFWFH